MKIAPASRRVTDASWLPPVNIDRARAMRREGTAVADRASITATVVNPELPHRGGDHFRVSTIR
jgi:hypothetical protein